MHDPLVRAWRRPPATRSVRRSLLAVWLLLGALACRDARETDSAQAPVSSADVVSRDELAAFLDWQLALQRYTAEVMTATKPLLDAPDVSAEKLHEITARIHDKHGKPLQQTPLRDSRKLSVLSEVQGAFYISGCFFRDEKELARLRAKWGASVVDSAAAQEALFKEKLGTCFSTGLSQ
jgi:hypothetical protein